MTNDRLQNHISESTLTLPVCAAIAVVLWFVRINPLSFRIDVRTAVSLLSVILTTYIVMETNTANSLLRIRSRMVSAVWVMGISMMTFSHDVTVTWITVPLMAATHYLLFKTYQDPNPVNYTFHIFFLLGTMILIMPNLYVLIPLYFWYMAVFMRSLSWRAFWAGLIGLAMPSWFLFGWCAANGDYTMVTDIIGTIASPQPIEQDNYTTWLSVHNPRTLTWCCLTFVTSVATIHYLRNYFKDKIRTRMYLYIYVIQTVAIWLLLLWQPDKYDRLMPLFMLCAGTLIAHHFALTGTILSNLFFVLSVLAWVALTTINMGLWKL